MKTSELIGTALKIAVGIADKRQIRKGLGGSIEVRGRTETGDELPEQWDLWMYWNPETNWSQGGPIVEREIFKLFKNIGGTFTAQVKTRVSYYSPTYDADIGRDEVISRSGPTPLIAAMRCYVASKLGDEVEIPEELK